MKRNPASAGPVAIVCRVLGVQLVAGGLRWVVRKIVKGKRAAAAAAPAPEARA